MTASASPTAISSITTRTVTRSARSMNQGRWYPTTCALGNGETLVLSGTNSSGQLNPLPQVLQTNQTWRPLNSASDTNMTLYPRMLLAPNSRVFMAGERSMARYLLTSGAGTWQDVDDTDTNARDYGSAVMYDDGKVLIMGGGAPTNTAQKINLNVDDPRWTPVAGMGSIAPMGIPRRQLNATLLADGQVLVTGGSSAPGFSNPAGAVFGAEMWNPATAIMDADGERGKTQALSFNLCAFARRACADGRRRRSSIRRITLRTSSA